MTGGAAWPWLVVAAIVATGIALIFLSMPRTARPQGVAAPEPETPLLNRIREAAADGVVTSEERAAIDELAAEHGLTPAQAQEAYVGVLSNMMQRRLDEILLDGELSPDEDADMSRLAAGLGIQLGMTVATTQAVEDARRLWQIRNAALPAISSPVGLQKSESAYAAVWATASELRSRTRSVSYAGPSVRIRIMRGVSYNVGHRNVSRQTQEYEHPLGYGPLVVTNKRLIFAGDRQAITSRLGDIIQIEPYSDAVMVMRANGKPRLFRFATPDPWFCAILERARSLA